MRILIVPASRRPALSSILAYACVGASVLFIGAMTAGMIDTPEGRAMASSSTFEDMKAAVPDNAGPGTEISLLKQSEPEESDRRRRAHAPSSPIGTTAEQTAAR